MWGTLGLTFNPEYVSSEDMNSWGALWLDKYHNQSTIKDSIRDSYFIGVARVWEDVLMGLKEQLDAGNISIEEYNDQLKIIFNDTSEETVNNVEKVLKELKDNIWGFEVDSGKNDIASGKITINFAWSGDAVYAMDEAEKQGVELYYTVPEEGSNVWFDGWCVPKNAKNVELAVEFMNFLSRPEIVVRNMSYIGYTSGVGGQEVFDNAIDWYGACTLEESELAYEDYMLLPKEEKDYYAVTNDYKVYEYIYIDTETIKEQDGNLYVNVLGVNEDGFLYNYDLEIYAIDLSYFFGEGDWVIYVDTLGRQFSAQYPTKDVIDRCVVMNCYNEEANIRVTQMWERVKGFTFSNTVLIIIGCLVIACIIFGVLVKYREKLNIKITIKPRPNKNRQKYKVEKIEKIN